MSQPLVITGMHHSGTSVVAELFKRAGVFMGDRLLSPDSAKPRGYIEDADFLALEREMVAAAAPAGEPGWHDWGWTTKETLREEIWPRYESRAHQLVESRSASHPLWGWKNPRTSLLLDFWLRLLPNAKFIFVCREPWAVAASLQKLGIELFDRNPEHAVRAWSFYNRRLLAFHGAHPDRCLFLPVAQLNKTPHKILDRITARFGFAFITHDRATCNEIVHAWAPAAGSASAAKSAEKQFTAEFPEATALWRSLTDAAVTQWDTTSTVAVAAPVEVAPPPPPPPRVSIVIPCFNDGRFLPDAIQSVEACKDGLHETVIVNDGSTDPETLEVLESLASRNFNIVRQENRGVAEALNAGIRASIGEFILPLASDNKLREAYITRGVEALDANPELGVVYGDGEWFGDQAGPRAAAPFDFQRLHIGNFIDACAVFRRRVWEDVGGYDPALALGYEDWDFWLSAAGKGWKFHYIPEVLFDYRLRDGTLSQRTADPDTHRSIVRHIVAKHPSYVEKYPDVIAEMSALMIQSHGNQNARARIRELEAELEKAHAELAATRGQVRLIQQTRSWRMTSPLRAIHRVVNNGPH